MKKSTLRKSIYLGICVFLSVFIFIVIFTDYTYTNSNLLMKHVLETIYFINFSIILSASVLIGCMTFILLIFTLENSAIKKSALVRAKNVYNASILILALALLLYFSMHYPIKEFEAWIKTVYWINSILISLLVGGFFILLYMLALPHHEPLDKNSEL